MKEVKVMKKFKCDFCNKRRIKRVMEFHEKICWKNPNRFCEKCKNTGKYMNDTGVGLMELDCPYCSQYEPEKYNHL